MLLGCIKEIDGSGGPQAQQKINKIIKYKL
jgi:hypothetical protein